MSDIPKDTLAYPVLITLSSGVYGSGFFLTAIDNGHYLVTCRHVLFDPQTGELLARNAQLISYPKNPSDTGRNVMKLDLNVLLAARQIRQNSEADVAVVKIATAAGNFVDGVEAIESAASGILAAPVQAVTGYNKVLVGNAVIVFGYPRSLGMPRIFQQLDPDRPLLRRGLVAGLNPGRHVIVLDCPTYPGNSGGPVMQIEQLDLMRHQFTIIGIVQEFVPYEEFWVNQNHHWVNSTISNSGYSIVTPIDYVLELLKQPWPAPG